MEHVRGETLARLLELAAERGEQPRPAVAVAIAVGALAGLDAAHDARDDAGQPLGIVHRDVSPQNILVGIDGVPRILDFGIAKAMSRLHTTRPGQIKGKLAYMAPEQRHGRAVDRRADVYAMGIVLWELLTGRRLFGADGAGPVAPPSTLAVGVSEAVDAAVQKALARDPDERFASARDFAVALEEGGGLASTRAVSEWLRHLAGDEVAARDRAAFALERAAVETAIVPLPVAVAEVTVVEPRPLAAPPRRAPNLQRIALVALALAVVSAIVLWAVRARRAGRAHGPRRSAPRLSSGGRMAAIDPNLPIITEILQQGDQLTLRTRTIRVEVLSGPSAGQAADLAGPEARIGSGRGVDLLLLDGAVSRHHLTLRAGRDGLRVCDAGSRNGTLLDGVRVVDAYARQGSILSLGTSTLRVTIGQGTVELPLSPRTRFGGLLGASIAMRRLYTILERVAPTDDTVLIEGETGTGKELVAEALHEESARVSAPFVVFDCSAVAANLIESELFGHVRGAFTGAASDRAGAFEAADGGTLFLDEIGELPLTSQPKLLRALEKLEVRRVGANASRKVDLRIVAATNKNLAEEVGRGTFREDLLYRLAVVRVTLPPLRDRLTTSSCSPATSPRPTASGPRARRCSTRRRSGPCDRAPTPATCASCATRWRGPSRSGTPTPRRRRRASERPRPLARGPSISTCPSWKRATGSWRSSSGPYLREALRHCGGNATKAAEMVGLNRKFLQRAIARHGLRKDD